MKNYIHWLIAKTINIFFLFLKILGPRTSSNLCALIFIIIGPLTKFQFRAKINLNLAFPKLSEKQKKKILYKMWSNIGKNIGEFIHLKEFNPYLSNHTDIVGENYLEAAIKNSKKNKRGVIFFAAHLANWEMGPLSLTKKNFRPLCVYRKSNNIYLNNIIQNARINIADYVPKGDVGAKKIFSSLRKGKPVAILMDQKLNEGISINFLGTPAFTATAIAELAIRLNTDIIPVRFERKGTMSFRVTFYNKLEKPSKSLPHEKKVKNIIRTTNKIISNWIRQKPEDWLWIHRRWPDKYYKK